MKNNKEIIFLKMPPNVIKYSTNTNSDADEISNSVENKRTRKAVPADFFLGGWGVILTISSPRQVPRCMIFGLIILYCSVHLGRLLNVSLQKQSW